MQQKEYVDFELEIDCGAGQNYPVRVLHSEAGEARAIMHFPFDKSNLENRLQALQIALLRSGSTRRRVQRPEEEQTVQQFGSELFSALFTGEIGKLYARSQMKASDNKKGLRLKLRICSPELATLPWEFLYDLNLPRFSRVSRGWS